MDVGVAGRDGGQIGAGLMARADGLLRGGGCGLRRTLGRSAAGGPLVARLMHEHVAAEDYGGLLERSMSAAQSIGEAFVVDDPPTVPSADPRAFGLALATVDGEVQGVGDWQQPFPIQSVSKAVRARAHRRPGRPATWDRVGREPSGDPFNSLLQLEYDQGVPRNPFINAGALVVTDHLLSVTGDAFGAVCEFVRDQSGNPAIRPDPAVAAWEVEHGIATRHSRTSSPATASSGTTSRWCSTTTSGSARSR